MAESASKTPSSPATHSGPTDAPQAETPVEPEVDTGVEKEKKAVSGAPSTSKPISEAVSESVSEEGQDADRVEAAEESLPSQDTGAAAGSSDSPGASVAENAPLKDKRAIPLRILVASSVVLGFLGWLAFSLVMLFRWNIPSRVFFFAVVILSLAGIRQLYRRRVWAPWWLLAVSLWFAGFMLSSGAAALMKGHFETLIWKEFRDQTYKSEKERREQEALEATPDETAPDGTFEINPDELMSHE